MTEDLAKIRDRIKKMLALGNDKSATEAEAASALDMAAALMARYNIQIDASTNLADKEVIRGRWISHEHLFHRLCGNAAAFLYNCQVITSGPQSFQFVGRTHNIDAAYDTYQYIVEQVEHLYKVNLPKGMSKSDRANYRRTFKFACAGRVYHRASEIVSSYKQSSNAQSMEKIGSNVLVVVESLKQQLEEVSNFMGSIDGLRPGKPVRHKFGSGSGAGNRAGDKVNLNRQLG